MFISIHLMLMLIGDTLETSVYAQNFNTSHVNVNQIGLMMENPSQKFQYISC